MPRSNIFSDSNLFGDDESKILDELQNVRTPVRPDDFIHIQVHYLLDMLGKQKNNAPDYRIEKQYKERVIDNLYSSNAQPFKSTEQQLGKFFQSIIQKLVTFRDEVLIDFDKGVIPDDSKKVSE